MKGTDPVFTPQQMVQFLTNTSAVSYNVGEVFLPLPQLQMSNILKRKTKTHILFT